MKLPSPSMAVALTALVVAGSGTAVAATQLAKNSVGASQIKAGAVRGSEVKNNALTGGDVKDGTLTGADVDESKLGTVPGAAKAQAADTAVTAGFASAAANAASATRALDADKLGGKAASGFVSSADVQVIEHRFEETGSETLFTRGSLTVSARCYDNGTTSDGTTNQDGVEIFIATSKDGAMFAGADTLDGGAAPTDYLNDDTALTNRQLVSNTTADSTNAQLFTPIDDLVAVDADGNGFTTGGKESFAITVNHDGSKCSVAFPVTMLDL